MRKPPSFVAFICVAAVVVACSGARATSNQSEPEPGIQLGDSVTMPTKAINAGISSTVAFSAARLKTPEAFPVIASTTVCPTSRTWRRGRYCRPPKTDIRRLSAARMVSVFTTRSTRSREKLSPRPCSVPSRSTSASLPSSAASASSFIWA